MYAAVGIAWRRGARTTGWWLAAMLAGALLVLDLAGQVHRGVADWKTLYFLTAMTIALLVGLWAWAWRSPRMGKLMFWWPALVLAADLPNAFPDSSLVSTIGLGTLVFGYIVFAQMALSYPPAGSSRDAWHGSTSSFSATSRRRSRTWSTCSITTRAAARSARRALRRCSTSGRRRSRSRRGTTRGASSSWRSCRSGSTCSSAPTLQASVGDTAFDRTDRSSRGRSSRARRGSTATCSSRTGSRRSPRSRGCRPPASWQRR